MYLTRELTNESSENRKEFVERITPPLFMPLKLNHCWQDDNSFRNRGIEKFFPKVGERDIKICSPLKEKHSPSEEFN